MNCDRGCKKDCTTKHASTYCCMAVSLPLSLFSRRALDFLAPFAIGQSSAPAPPAFLLAPPQDAVVGRDSALGVVKSNDRQAISIWL